MSSAAKLDYFVKNNKNVLFIGKHGVGKTGMIEELFNRHKLNWRYYSASTMDPWVDFVGVPKEKTENKLPEQFEVIRELAKINFNFACEWIQNNWKMNPESSKQIVSEIVNRKQGLTYLDLVRPHTFATGGIEALFFDEFNRSPKKVRNAVMELIQFKSINGLKFPNLRLVWAAINPDDDEENTYDVEKLDPAQQDRFHVTMMIPYKPNAAWFRQKYGNKIADSAIEWWNQLPKEQQNLISPRRLQYALDFFVNDGDIRDALPLKSGVSKLISALNNGSISDKISELLTKKDDEETRLFLQNENQYESAMKYIEQSETLISYFIPLIPKEKIAALMNENDKICQFVISNSVKHEVFASVCLEIINAKTNQQLIKRIKRSFTENPELAVAISGSGK